MTYDKLNETEKNKFISVCNSLPVNPDWLYKLIDFESRWNPLAKNPLSGARGLIQFTNKTARSMGYSSADDLVFKYPSIVSQLDIVYNYLKPYRPFPTEQSLTMAVFYPDFRYAEPDKAFPDTVTKDNPGINTPADYMRLVFGQSFVPQASIWIVVALVAGLLICKAKGWI